MPFPYAWQEDDDEARDGKVGTNAEAQDSADVKTEIGKGASVENEKSDDSKEASAEKKHVCSIQTSAFQIVLHFIRPSVLTVSSSVALMQDEL